MNAQRTAQNAKPLGQRISECKELIIQNMQKTLQSKMVYMFLKDRKKQDVVKTYSVNSRDGIIKIEFTDHKTALQFYRQCNFSEKILIRPFNMYFNLALAEGQMKKYYLQGITEENQKKLFEAAYNDIGICKIYTSYGSISRAKLKSTGLLSFIRQHPIKEEQFNKLKKDLQQLNIKIYQYVHEKGTKVSLNLLNILPEEKYFDLDDAQLQKITEEKAREIIDRFADKPNIQHVSVICKKKEVTLRNSEEKKNKLQTSALFEFDNADVTYKIYEKVRKGMISELGKVRLFFHNQENNSYLSLVTQNLVKEQKDTEKQFQEKLIKAFQQINKNVVQVNVFPVTYNNTYFGRVYLTNDEEGKLFLVDYANFRSKIYSLYKEKSNIIFNISIDTKTLRKLKNAEKKAKETEERVKKQSQANKRERPQRNNQVPNFAGMPFGGPMMAGSNMPGMMGPPMTMPHSMTPNMPGFAPKGIPGGLPGPSSIPPSIPMTTKDKVANLIRDKERFINMPQNNAKRVISDVLKAVAEEAGVTGTQGSAITNDFLGNNSVANIYKSLESLDTLKEEFRRRAGIN